MEKIFLLIIYQTQMICTFIAIHCEWAESVYAFVEENMKWIFIIEFLSVRGF